jgi:hypothetical protein
VSDHVFTGPGAHSYPHSKDRTGHPIGQVEPGDTRDTDEPLDPNWVSARSKAGKAAIEAAEQARAATAKAEREAAEAAEDGQPSGETGQQAAQQAAISEESAAGGDDAQHASRPGETTKTKAGRAGEEA